MGTALYSDFNDNNELCNIGVSSKKPRLCIPPDWNRIRRKWAIVAFIYKYVDNVDKMMEIVDELPIEHKSQFKYEAVDKCFDDSNVRFVKQYPNVVDDKKVCIDVTVECTTLCGIQFATQVCEILDRNY